MKYSEYPQFSATDLFNLTMNYHDSLSEVHADVPQRSASTCSVVAKAWRRTVRSGALE